jgi:hypothetical protein
MSAGKETPSSSTVTKPTKTEQTLFEEDDEFEEFPAEGTNALFKLVGSVVCII